jgi:hypothetical protein
MKGSHIFEKSIGSQGRNRRHRIPKSSTPQHSLSTGVFHILTKHGKHARAAFAMTFIANNHGVVYQKNCGASAQPLANPIRRMLSNRPNQSKESP